MYLDLYRTDIEAFCHKWNIAELSVFGSVLRNDFTPDSDVDLLVSFDPAARWGLWDYTMMQDELQNLLGRPVDLLTKNAVERSRNPLRKQAILSSAKTYYHA